MTEVLYPWGYQKALVTMSRLKELARADLCEPETWQRIEAYLVSQGGEMGIGGAVRFTQPDKPGFAEDGKSFHQIQEFHSGMKAYAAFDVVKRNGAGVHRAPRWDEVPKQGTKHPAITDYGVHANVAGEPWHIQAIEVDGWATWVKNGRPHPNGNFPIKGGAPTAPPAQTQRDLYLTAPTMRGPDVGWVQQKLRASGLSISIDTIFGRQTRDRVMAFQERNGLQVDGRVGPKTFEALNKV